MKHKYKIRKVPINIELQYKNIFAILLAYLYIFISCVKCIKICKVPAYKKVGYRTTLGYNIVILLPKINIQYSKM